MVLFNLAYRPELSGKLRKSLFLGCLGEVFVHYTGLNMEGFKSLEEGAAVEFDVTDGAKGPQAVNVTVVG